MLGLLALAAPRASATSIFPSSPFSANAAGTTGAAFLKIPTGARAEGMGEAASAGADGVEAMLWNPAGLARMNPGDPAELGVGYNSLLETAYSGSALYARPWGESSAWGAGFVYFSQSAQTAYNSVATSVGSFTPNDLAAHVSYARRVGGYFVGGSFKVIRSQISEVTGTSAAVDLGVQAPRVTEAGDGAVDLGASLSNLGPPIKLGSVSAPLPFSMRGGFLWHTTPVINTALDVNLPVDNDPYVSFGVEAKLKYGEWGYALRGGYNQNHTRNLDGLTGLSIGGGLDVKAFRLDYAWVPYGDLGTTNRISLVFRF